MKNTRIKIVTMLDGSQKFFPQWKGLIFWHSLTHHIENEFTPTAEYDTLLDAQLRIDRYLARVESLITVKMTYVKYP